MYEVLYANPKVLKFIQSLDKDLNAFNLIQNLAQRGNILDEHHSKTRCHHIFKIRIKNANHCVRIFYSFSDKLLILHAYYKKDQKTRNKELNLAKKRLREIHQKI